MRTLPLLIAVAAGAMSIDQARAEIGALVPAYFYPVVGSPWDDLVDAAGTIPVTAILNPASGPGGSQDSNYVAVVDALRAAGGAVVGYVHSSWGSRSLAEVVAEIDRYANWYAIDGIFVDEMSTGTAAVTLDYYANVYNHVKGVDADWQVIGNPGVQTAETYLSRPAADVLVVSEDAGRGYPSYVPSAWNDNYSATQIAHLVHAVPDEATMESFVELGAARNAGWLFLTDDTLPNPWDTLPAYWDAEVAQLRVATPGGMPIGQLGDMDHDGDADFDDINPMVTGLIDPAAYTATFGLAPSANGDLNQDGELDLADIPGFVALLAGSMASPAVAPVAEPASGQLAMVAAALFCGYLLMRHFGSTRRGGRATGRPDDPQWPCRSTNSCRSLETPHPSGVESRLKLVLRPPLG